MVPEWGKGIAPHAHGATARHVANVIFHIYHIGLGSDDHGARVVFMCRVKSFLEPDPVGFIAFVHQVQRPLDIILVDIMAAVVGADDMDGREHHLTLRPTRVLGEIRLAGIVPTVR